MVHNNWNWKWDSVLVFLWAEMNFGIVWQIQQRIDLNCKLFESLKSSHYLSGLKKSNYTLRNSVTSLTKHGSFKRINQHAGRVPRPYGRNMMNVILPWLKVGGSTIWQPFVGRRGWLVFLGTTSLSIKKLI
jgi:hypothetical protein